MLSVALDFPRYNPRTKKNHDGTTKSGAEIFTIVEVLLRNA